jgi:hypothetical protein
MVLKSRRRSPDWSADGDRELEAKCRRFEVQRDRDPWFDDEEQAVEICRGSSDGVECPMRAKCLGMALVNNEQFGVFGGFHLVQRRWIRKHFALHEWAYPNPINPNLFDKVPPLSFFAEDPPPITITGPCIRYHKEDPRYGHGQKAAS